jgi:hypothetical protein
MHLFGAILGMDKMMFNNFTNGLKVLKAIVE